MTVSSSILLLGSAMAAILAVGAVFHRPPTVARLAFGAGMALFAAETIFAWLSTAASSQAMQLEWLRWRHVATVLLPGVWILFSVTYARGNYGEFIKRWRWTIAAAIVAPVTICIVYFKELVFVLHPWTGARSEGLFLSWPANWIQLVCLVSAVLVLMNLERTFRSAVGVMRWRLKYTVLGMAAIFGERVYSCSQTFLLSSAQPSTFLLDALVLFMGGLLTVVAVFRAGFFKVDVYPSHTLLSNSITAIFVGIYLLVVGVLAKVVRHYGRDFGQLWQAATVIALLVALGVVLFSERTRQAFRLFVSRHLRRPSYDYRQIWARFTERTGSMVDPDEYARAVVRWIADTCESLSVTLWFVDETRRRIALGASTSLDEHAANPLPRPDNMEEILDELHQRPDPIDLDATSLSGAWVDALRRCNPDQFRTGGHRMCVPLFAQNQMVGILVAGDRVAGRPFTPEDLDLLQCLADQLASSLLNFRLSRRVMEGKQMEAFQTMSAFFVHDLKNTASTLSLMLQNLPTHFDNPEFRKDALRAVGKTVDHINDLIQRLGLLRRELEVRPVDMDVNQLVEAALASVQGAPGLRLTKQLREVPTIRGDRDQLGKVLTNLLLNARDALAGREGEIAVETNCNDDCVTLSVTDNGCGMSQDFVEKQLFKPFQTTKKKGIGIGMFHSRMIVEAHHGRVEVETEAGRGTTFRVVLPRHGRNT